MGSSMSASSRPWTHQVLAARSMTSRRSRDKGVCNRNEALINASKVRVYLMPGLPLCGAVGAWDVDMLEERVDAEESIAHR